MSYTPAYGITPGDARQTVCSSRESVSFCSPKANVNESEIYGYLWGIQSVCLKKLAFP